MMMNERIQQLADKAGWIYEGNSRVPDMEKFAELIVREMCQVMKDEGEQFSLDHDFDAVKGVGRCMRRVKEHFGVDK